MNDIDFYINNGISRIILGSVALKNPELVKEAVKEFESKIAVGIDAKSGYVATEGWVEKSDVYFTNLAKRMEDVGVKNIIFTDISRDGTLTGPNLEQLVSNQEFPHKCFCRKLHRKDFCFLIYEYHLYL